jgi:hypothetical protein
MPREKDFKRRVRRRMRETGERYVVAREAVRGEVVEGPWTRVERAGPHLRRRLRLSARISGQDVKFRTALWMRVTGPEQRLLAFDVSEKLALSGTFDWTAVQVVLDVAEEAVSVSYGVLRAGPGTIRSADVRLEVVTQDVPLTQSFPENGWQSSGNSHAYTLTREQAQTPDGVRDVMVLRSRGEAGDSFRSMTRGVHGHAHRGRRLRLAGLLSTENVTGRVGLWMRVDGLNWERLAYDDMEDRALTGTTAWTRAAVVLDVPPDAERVFYGVLLRGSGAVRSTEIEFEPVDESVPVTRRYAIPGWVLTGPGVGTYDVAVESGEPPAGRRVCVIRATADPGSRAATLTQLITTPGYRGGTVRLRATLQGEDVTSVGLVVRCLDPYDLDLREPARSATLSGTFNWRRATVEVPVPWRAASIVFGLEVVGRGTVRMGDVRFDVVRVGMAADWREPPNPRNLDFTE